MSALPPRVRAIAETLNLFLPLSPREVKVVDPRYAAFIGSTDNPHRNVVQRLRLEPDAVEATLAEVRALFRARERHQVTWEVGPSSAPADLLARLGALGLGPEPTEPLVTGMALTRPLPALETELAIRRVTSLADFRAAGLVFSATFGASAPPPDEAQAAEEYAEHVRLDQFARYVALLDGEVVAAGDAIFLDEVAVLGGAATLPEARGRGAYRALVRARFDEAARRGTPTLITQAGSMSRPILAALGFEVAAEIRVLLDTFE